jgi:hypothetical protein
MLHPRPNFGAPPPSALPALILCALRERRLPRPGRGGEIPLPLRSQARRRYGAEIPAPRGGANLPRNSHGIISFADPHPLTPAESYRYKIMGVGGLSPTSLGLSPISCPLSPVLTATQVPRAGTHSGRRDASRSPGRRGVRRSRGRPRRRREPGCGRAA